MSETRTCSDERMCINCFADNGECLGPYKKATSTICKACNGVGKIHTGIAEWSSTQCNKCEGTGETKP